MIEGSCLCGDVAWEIDGPLEWMAHCHCSICRKSHGTAFATFVTFAASGFRWVRGEGGIRRHESSPGSFRAFCGHCGSKLPAVEPFAYAHAGPLTGDLGIRPSCHMFAGSKAPWHTISDALPQHAAFPDATPPVPTARSTEPAEGKVRGSCLCGAAAYEVDGPLVGGGIVSCHCSRCRRARAAVHGSNLFVESASFRWLRGADALAYYKLPDAGRFGQSFCATCGSPMPAAQAIADRRMIPAGSLDDDPGVRETIHIYTGSRAPWHEITGDLPQYPTLPEGGFPPVARTAR